MRRGKAVLLVTIFAMVAVGVPSTSSAQSPAEIRSRIASLKKSLQSVSARLDHAEHELEDAEDAVARHNKAVRTANARRTMLRRAISSRAAELYRVGAAGGLQLFVQADDLQTVVDRLSYLEQARRGERAILEEIASLTRRAASSSKALESARARARAERSRLDARQNELSRQLSELTRLQKFLDSVTPRRIIRGSRSGVRGFICPVVGPNIVSNNFGDPRPGGPHGGVDIRAKTGQYVRAVLPARVVDTPYGSWWGIGIVIRDLAGNEWWYAHLSSESVSVGQRVAAGELIGRVGCTGRCYGSHLHFEYHPGGGAPRDPYRIASSVC